MTVTTYKANFASELLFSCLQELSLVVFLSFSLLPELDVLLVTELKEPSVHNLYDVCSLAAYGREASGIKIKKDFPRKYTLVSGAFTANSAPGMPGDRQPYSSLSTDEPPPLPCSSEPATDGTRDLPPPLEVLENTPPSSASARNAVCAAVNTDVGDQSSCSRRDCIRGGGGFSSCLSISACFLAASSTLRGYGWSGFLLGRGGGIWMAGAAPPEALSLPNDSLITCRAEDRERQEVSEASSALLP
jgi:hypothetical protein